MKRSNVQIDDEDSALAYGVPIGDFICLSVSDNGSGMSPEVKARVFEPFFRKRTKRDKFLDDIEIVNIPFLDGGLKENNSVRGNRFFAKDRLHFARIILARYIRKIIKARLIRPK